MFHDLSIKPYYTVSGIFSSTKVYKNFEKKKFSTNFNRKERKKKKKNYLERRRSLFPLNKHHETWANLRISSLKSNYA